MKTSCYVIGAAYSGTTLFNALIDTQPRVRGIGEAIRHIRRGPRSRDPWCASCNQPVDKCNRKPQVHGSNIHEAFFERYQDTDVLVDISKSWSNCFRWQQTSYPIKIISMTKWPHAFAWSQLNHYRRRGEERTTEECFEAWILAYESAEMMYNLHSSWGNRRSLQLGKSYTYPILHPDNFLEIAYHELVTDTAGTMRRACDFLGVEFDPDALGNWWKPTSTCTVGGNQAIYAQRNNGTFFADVEESRKYLAGKYIGKRGAIFADTSWLHDDVFIGEARESYVTNRKRLRRLVQLFGLIHFRDCVKALTAP